MKHRIPLVSPRALAERLEGVEGILSKAADVVYGLALDDHERASQIRARLGVEHPAVRGWDDAIAAKRSLIIECEGRFGKAVPFDGMWVDFLRSYKRPCGKGMK